MGKIVMWHINNKPWRERIAAGEYYELQYRERFLR